MKYVTDLDAGDIIYTDSNGREMQRREKNTRCQYQFNDTQVAGKILH